MTSKPGLQVRPSLRRVRSPSRGGGALGAGGGGTGLCLACLMLCPAWGGRWISHPGMAFLTCACVAKMAGQAQLGDRRHWAPFQLPDPVYRSSASG